MLPTDTRHLFLLTTFRDLIYLWSHESPSSTAHSRGTLTNFHCCSIVVVASLLLSGKAEIHFKHPSTLVEALGGFIWLKNGISLR